MIMMNSLFFDGPSPKRGSIIVCLTQLDLAHDADGIRTAGAIDENCAE